MKIVATLLIAMLLCSCLTMEQTLKFTKDGIVIVNYAYTYPAMQEASLAEALKRMGAMDVLSEKDVATFCTANGVELRSYRKRDNGRETTIQIVMMARNGGKALNQGLFGPFQVTAVDDRIRCVMTMPKLTPPKNRPALDGFSATLNILAPAAIVSTNGRHLSPEAVTWTLDDKNTPPEQLVAEWQ